MRKNRIEKAKKSDKPAFNIFRKIFVDNIGYKLLALSVSIVLWIIVIGLGLGGEI